MADDKFDPSRAVPVADEDGFNPDRAVPVETTAGDVAKAGAAGVIQGLGSIAQGGGNILAQLVNRGSEALTGYNPMLRAEDPLKPVSEAILGSRTAGGKAAMELSTPDGNIVDPSTWTAGKDPSIGGYLQHTANVIGQFVGPGGVGAIGKAGKLTAGAQAVLGAAQGALQAGGAAADQEGRDIRAASNDKLWKDSEAYRDYLSRGMTPGEARERTALDVEAGAGTVGAIPAAIQGAVLQGLLRGKLKMPVIGKGPLARAASAAAEGTVGEGAQEYTEGVAQKLGANIGGGMDQSLNEGSVQNIVLGAIGGAAGGGIIHGIAPKHGGENGGGKEKPPAPLALPAPGMPLGNVVLPNDGGPNAVSQQLHAEAVAASATAQYAARAAEEERLARFASQGVLSAAAATAMANGTAAEKRAQRQGDINESLSPAAPLALPAPANEQERLERAKIDEYLAGNDPVKLADAQRMSFDGAALGHDLVVVPHPSGKGYTTIPASELSDRQMKAVERIQRPDQGQLPSPNTEMPGAWVAPEGRTPEPQTYGNNEATARAAYNAWRTENGTPIPRQLPIADVKRAAQIAERRSQEEGREYVVVPHPLSSTRFAVAPTPQTFDGEASRVPEPQQKATSAEDSEQTQGVNNAEGAQSDAGQGARNGAAEAAATQRPGEGVAGHPADGAGAQASPAGAAAAQAAQLGNDQVRQSVAAVPDSAFNSDLEHGLNNIFLADDHDGSPVPLANHGFRDDEIEALQRAGMADENGAMSREQFSAWSAERGARLNGGKMALDYAAHEAATSPGNAPEYPTVAQAEAGNYKKGHVKLHGLDISIENPAGSVRVASDGSWASVLPHHYGYIRRTEGNDGDHIDVFVGPKPTSTQAFVVDQADPKTGKFDEHKVMLGFDSVEAAEAAYRAAYPADWEGMRAITPTTVDALKSWIKTGDTKAQFAQNVGEHAIDFKPTPGGFQSASLDFAARPVTQEDPASLPEHAHLFGKPAAKITDIDGGHQANWTEARSIAATVKELLRLGLPKVALNGLSPIFVRDGSHSGVYINDSGDGRRGAIGLSRDDMQQAALGDKWASMTQVGKLAHEVIHHISGNADGVAFVQHSPAFEISSLDSGSRIPRGDVIKEVFDAWRKGKTELRAYLNYPLAGWGAKPHDALHTLVLQDEVLAQIGRLYYTNPRLLRLEMPKAFALMEEIHNGVSNAGTIGAARGAVLAALRASTASVGAAVDARAGTHQVDERRAVGEQASAGVGERAVRESGGDQAGQRRGVSGQRNEGLAGAPAAGQAQDAQRLIGAPEGKDSYEPSARAQQAAYDYMREAGLPYDPPTHYVKVDPEHAARIAQAYADMKHDPRNIRVARAYRQMIKETIAQWKAIERTGLKVTFADKDHPYPYKTPREAFNDVANNNHLWVYPTNEGFGNSNADFDPKNNPLLAETGITIGGHKLLANDVFRIVHDYFGHIKPGVGFRANGEENAWRSHAAMYSELARQAMTSETRGQNSWLNFGPHGETNRTAKTEDTVFADQKTGLLPSWAVNDGRTDDLKRPKREVNTAQTETFDPKQIKSAVGNNGNFDLKRPSMLEVRENADGTAIVNIGLDTPDGKGITREQALRALRDAGVKVQVSEVRKSRTEQTLIAALDRALTPEEAHKVSDALHQEAIAQKVGETGELYGPKAEEWRPFNDRFFLKMSKEGENALISKRADEVLKSAGGGALTPQELDVLKRGVPRVAMKRAQRFAALFALFPKTTEYVHAALAGRAARGWYRKSRIAGEAMYGRDYPRFAGLMAALSPQTDVPTNFYNAAQVWADWNRSGRPTDAATISQILTRNIITPEGEKAGKEAMDAYKLNGIRVLRHATGDVQLSGPKVESFRQNLRGDLNEVTNDRHNAAFSGIMQSLIGGTQIEPVDNIGKKFSIKSPGYIALSVRYRQAARELTRLTGERWTPAEVQETSWSFWRTLYNLATAKGETRSALQLIRDGALTHELIAETPTLGQYFDTERFRAISRGEAQAADGDADAASRISAAERGVARETGPVAETPAIRRIARRLDQLVADRAEQERLNAEQRAASEQALYEEPRQERGDAYEGNIAAEQDDEFRIPGFDDDEPALKRDRAEVNVAHTVTNGVLDLFQTQKSFNLWDRTVGTQLHKALRNPRFKRVYDGVQRFLNDASTMMMQAADLAPDLLPKLDGIKDVFKRAPSKAALKNVASAVFDGTLQDRVWSDDDLRQRGLDDQQVGLYRQARAAIDKSLADVFTSEAVKEAKGLLPQHVLDAARETGDFWSVVNALGAIQGKTAVQQQVYDQLRLRAAQISDMQRDGYAPLQRFGQYTVHVTNAAGDSVLFTMHESEREANAFARQARARLQRGETLTQGVMSQEAWKLFRGVSPDTLEIFAKSVGASNSEIMQKYIALAVNNRSVLKRMLQRKEIAGFQTDIQRTLAQFITSNARAASKNYNWGDVLEGQQAIPKEAGDVRDEAARLAEYVENPREEAGALRGLLFVQFLGGSIASAFTNATQPVMMTLPWLSQFGGVAKAGAQLLTAGKIAAGSTQMEPALAAAMAKATKEGIVAPHEVHGLYAESIRNFGSNMGVRRALKAWGSLFSLAEAFNRRITFVAAYRTAVEQGMANPYAFASRAIAETQGVYNKGNRPNWARGAVGGTLFTFKQYSVAYLELLARLPKKQQALMLAVLVLTAGLQGLPGADDLEDVIDTITESLGYSFNSKKQLREWAARTLGDTFGPLLTHGFSAMPGVPLDVQARLGLGNLIPGSAILKRSETDKSKDVMEFFGPVGSQAKAFTDAFSAAQAGDYAAVARAGLPLAVQNALKGLDMSQSGFYKDTRGRRVIDADAYDAAIKAIGFQPQGVAKQSRVMQDAQQDIDLHKDVQSKLVSRMAQAIVDKDGDALLKARQELLSWNQNNPESRIAITPQIVHQRVRQIMMTRDQRFNKSVPRGMRPAVMADLRQ